MHRRAPALNNYELQITNYLVRCFALFSKCDNIEYVAFETMSNDN